MRQYKCNAIRKHRIFICTQITMTFFCNNKNHNKTNILQAQKSLSSFVFKVSESSRTTICSF